MLILFFALSFLIVASALGVILFRNALHSALSLIVNLLGVACMFALHEAHFLAAVQIVVYAGAIMVLTVFVIMLLNTKSESFDFPTILLMIGGGVFGLAFIVMLAPLFQIPVPPSDPLAEPVVAGAKAIGVAIFEDYILPFQLSGLMLLAALIGAAMLSKTRRVGGGQS